MLGRITTLALSAALVATVVANPLATSDARAEFRSNTSCVEGFVDARDYAELSQNFREDSSDRVATLILNSEDEELTLKVLDLEGNSVCNNVADLRTRCTWELNPEDEFNVRIDNTTRDTETAYEVCAQ